ncbi:hypothetical protein [Halomarina litorea]|uniref:hypothetical protein n=1 Tax=Halomarina litorea TaxID=2961595 RepID=UPI0020C36A79|nr:hypothetical protein [Halomarina sp. BCD28]
MRETLRRLDDIVEAGGTGVTLLLWVVAVVAGAVAVFDALLLDALLARLGRAGGGPPLATQLLVREAVEAVADVTFLVGGVCSTLVWLRFTDRRLSDLLYTIADD